MFRIAEVSNGQPVDSHQNSCFRLGVGQARKPIAKHILTSARDVAADFDHCHSVTYKLQKSEPKCNISEKNGASWVRTPRFAAAKSCLVGHGRAATQASASQVSAQHRGANRGHLVHSLYFFTSKASSTTSCPPLRAS